MTEVIRTRFGSVNLRLRCVRELNNTQSILCALFLPQTKIYPTEILRPPSAYLRDVLGAEDEVRYSPCEDDKPKRAVNTRSEAGSDNFCHPRVAEVTRTRFGSVNFCHPMKRQNAFLSFFVVLPLIWIKLQTITKSFKTLVWVLIPIPTGLLNTCCSTYSMITQLMLTTIQSSRLPSASLDWKSKERR